MLSERPNSDKRYGYGLDAPASYFQHTVVRWDPALGVIGDRSTELGFTRRVGRPAGRFYTRP